MSPSESEKERPVLKWHCLVHDDPGECGRECALKEALRLLGKKNTLAIVRQLLLNRVLRFNELHERVGGSSKTLTDRLRELEGHGLLNRETFNEVPIRVEYSLSPAGLELESLFEALSQWARKWMRERGDSTS